MLIQFVVVVLVFHQFAPSTLVVSSLSSACTTNARSTHWRLSAAPCTSPSSHRAFPPRARVSSPCSFGHPSEVRCCPSSTTTTGTSLSSCMILIEVSDQNGSPLFLKKLVKCVANFMCSMYSIRHYTHQKSICLLLKCIKKPVFSLLTSSGGCGFTDCCLFSAWHYYGVPKALRYVRT